MGNSSSAITTRVPARPDRLSAHHPENWPQTHPRMRTKRGELTPYAYACGYRDVHEIGACMPLDPGRRVSVQVITTLEMPDGTNSYLVKQYWDNDAYAEWFGSLVKARKVYKHRVRIAPLLVD